MPFNGLKLFRVAILFISGYEAHFRQKPR